MLSLRYELHLLAHAFRKDTGDADRTGFHESHIAFYYKKYFNKSWSNRAYAVTDFKDVVALISENARITKAT